MKFMKKSLVLLMSAAMMLGMAACSSDDTTTTPEVSEETMTIGLVVSTLDNPFFVTLQDGAQAKADELGATLIVLDSKDDSAIEMTNVEDLLVQGVDLLMINPTDSAAVVSSVEAANEAGIPVVTLDRSADGGEVATHIASDNYAGGVMAGEYIVELLGGEGLVVELEGVPGASATIERGEGFNAAMDAVDTMEVIAAQTANFARAEGMSVMEDILQAQPEIDAVFAHNDEMALGALEAITASGRDILIVGFDATDDALAAVAEGTMAATVEQLPAEIGALGVVAAMDILAGEEVEAYVPVDLQLVVE